MFARLTIVKHWPALAFLPSLQTKRNPHDIPHDAPPEPEPKTGYERVVAIFELDGFGSPSKEMITSYNTGFFAGFVGGCVGGLKESQLKYHEFVTKLNAQMFQTHTEAKKELTMRLATTFAKSFIHWGVRLSFFTTLYTLTTNVLARYNDNVAVWNFSLSGCMTGALYRIPLGLRAMLVAGTLGAVLGTMAGCSCILILAGFDTKYDEIQEWHYKARQLRHEKMSEVVDAKDREKTMNPLLTSRTEVIQSGDLKSLK